MNRKVIADIQHDLNLIFPEGGYTLRVQEREPRLRLSWDDGVHPNLKRFSEEILRLHKVPFETPRYSLREASAGESKCAKANGDAGEGMIRT